MKKPEYNNPVIFYHEVDSIRESSKQAATEFVINLWIEQWIMKNLTGEGVKHPKKLLAESG